jgi:signal transduction histidine kinase
MRRSLLFRYTLIHAAIFALVMTGVLGTLYWSTLSAQEADVNREIEAEATELQGRLVGRSQTEMAAVVTRSSVGAPGRTTIYMLASERRQYIAGNLREWPHGLEPNARLADFALASGEHDFSSGERIRARALTLPAGQHLLVGRNLSEQDKLRAMIGRVFAAALGLTLLVGVAGAYLLSQRVSRRLEEINQGSEAILAGDLRRRMPETGRGDEIDVLARNLNRMLDRIESLMRGMREVTDDIAHDMRGPISRLRSRIEVALLAPPSEAQYRETLQATIDDADGLLAMFHRLLTIAHAESGEPRRHFESIDLANVARTAVEVYEPVADDAGIELRLDASGPVPLSGDPQLLGQAIGNLLDNAIKYVPRGGHVTICVEQLGERVRIVVRDDGPGIPAAFRERALERFTRLDESRTTPGSGLGLSLVRAVTALHEGTVELGDNHPGLIVTLDLPRGVP